MHWLSTKDPECLTSARTRYRFSTLTFPERIRASKNALCAEWTPYSSNSSKTVYELVSGFVLSIGSLLYISSLKTWSTILRRVNGSFLLGFIIWEPAARVAECRPPIRPLCIRPAGWVNWFKCDWLVSPVPFRFYSSFEASLKKTFLKTSSFFLLVSSNFTLLNYG